MWGRESVNRTSKRLLQNMSKSTAAETVEQRKGHGFDSQGMHELIKCRP